MNRKLLIVGVSTLFTLLTLFLILQLVLSAHAYHAQTIVSDYMGDDVCFPTYETCEKDYYDNQRDRFTLTCPPFSQQFRMHTTTFRWNEEKKIPPNADTNLSEYVVGRCLLTPKPEWQMIDTFGLLGPIECFVYGDWRVKRIYADH